MKVKMGLNKSVCVKNPQVAYLISGLKMQVASLEFFLFFFLKFNIIQIIT